MVRRVGRLGRITAAALVASLLVAAGCTGSEPKEEPTRRDLRIGFTAAPLNLDFTQNNGAAIPEALLVNVYEGLVKIDRFGSLVPLLAKDWKLSDDRTVYTFELQEDVKFSDGSRFTAKDAVYSIRRVKTGWSKDVSVAAAMDVVQKAEAVDPTTLRVTLKRPSNLWLYQMATRIGAMFPEGAGEKLANRAVGTGPYEVTAYKKGQRMKLKRRDNYWGEKPDVEDVMFRYFEDPNVLNNAMLDGQIDVISNVQAPESLSVFSNELKYRITEGSTNGEVLLSFNHAKAPLDELDVRKAIKYALDRRKIRDTAWDGRGQLIGSMVPPTDPWYEDLSNAYPHDPDKARRLLRGAGHGKGEISLRLRIPTLPYAEKSAKLVKSQLSDVGIKVEVDTLKFPSEWLKQVFNKKNYDMSIISHVEPWDMGVLFANPDYYLNYDNPDVQRFLEKADRGTRQEQITYMKKAAKEISDDAAADFLFLLPSLKVSSRRVEGVPVNTTSEAFDVTTLSLDPSSKS